MSRITDNTGTTEYSFDEYGRMNRVRKSITSSAGAQSRDLIINRGAVGKLTSLTYPSGRVVNYTRTRGRATSVDFQATAGGSSVNLGNTIDYFAFDEGPVRSLTFANGLVLARGRDQTQRLTSYAVSAGATQIVNRSYAYDKFDQIQSISDLITAANSQTFTYDRRARLDLATGVYGSYDYDYDLGDNRTARRFTPPGFAQPIVETYGIAATSNRLNSVSINNPNPGGGTFNRSFQYDARGNAISDVRSAGETMGFTYNDRNRLSLALKTTSSGSSSETYFYDASSQRVRSVNPTAERLYFYGPGGEILAETTATGTPVVEHVYLEGEPIVQLHGAVGSSQTYFVHASHLGTPEILTDGAKAIAWRIHAEPFGETFQETGAAVQRVRFPGQFADAGTRVSYNWHRYYDPSIGRYISADPIGHRGGINLYRYAANNPFRYSDPFGLFRFGSRPLDGGRGPWVPGISGGNQIADANNIELSHEHGFFEDGSGENIGFGEDGRFPENPDGLGYRYDDTRYDDALIRRALEGTADGPYSLLGLGDLEKNNCQDWADRLRGEYNRLLNEPGGQSSPYLGPIMSLPMSNMSYR